ncbi:hypothetical protein BDW74DRAFT_162384 [Aspergillus multicolor]|uniref:uncharacterized protein n=1 Tax=Aspergillus multicolor TaxID=41759 RepID=UPI003CCDECB0
MTVIAIMAVSDTLLLFLACSILTILSHSAPSRAEGAAGHRATGPKSRATGGLSVLGRDIRHPVVEAWGQ